MTHNIPHESYFSEIKMIVTHSLPSKSMNDGARKIGDHTEKEGMTTKVAS